MKSEAEYHAEFRKRLVALRKQLKWTQPQMAEALGVETDAYKKYEKRPKSKFPPHLYERLALVTHRDLEFIITGRSGRPLPHRAVA